MNNPLNELSAVYNQQIAEGCGCDEKKKVKLKVEIPGTKRPDGGDGAAPNDGKNLLATGNVPMGGSGAKRRVSKYAVEPLSSEEYTPVDEGHKQFPLDRVKKKIAKKEGEGKSVDAHAMKAVKNFSTKASDFSKDKGDEAKAKSKQFKSFEKKDRGDQDYHMRNKNPKSAVKSMLSAVSNEKKSKALKAVSNAGKRMEGYAPGDVDKQVSSVTCIHKDERDTGKERLLAKAKKKREAMKEGNFDV